MKTILMTQTQTVVLQLLVLMVAAISMAWAIFGDKFCKSRLKRAGRAFFLQHGVAGGVANGFNAAEEGHVIQLLAPQSISGGKTAQRFHMKNAQHASIIIEFGAFGTLKPTAILLKECSDINGTGATAIGYRYYLSKSGGTAQDLSSPPAVATDAGVLAAVLSKIDNQFMIIELDSPELSDGKPYVELSITDSGNTTYASAIAILSGNRYAVQGGVTATA